MQQEEEPRPPGLEDGRRRPEERRGQEEAANIQLEVPMLLSRSGGWKEKEIDTRRPGRDCNCTVGRALAAQSVGRAGGRRPQCKEEREGL